MADQKPTPKKVTASKAVPSTAPEITDDALLTKVQKQRINQEFDVEQPADTTAQSATKTSAADGPLTRGSATAATATSGTPTGTPTSSATPTRNDMADIDLSLNDDATGDTAAGADDGSGNDGVNNGAGADGNKPKRHRIRRFFAAYGRRWYWTVPLTLLVLAGILAAVPWSRYKLAGYVVSQPVTISVTDASTKKAVSSAQVVLDGVEYYKTDSQGLVTIQRVKPGNHQLTVSKKYFKDGTADVFVDLTKSSSQSISIQATGRQVPITVSNKLTGKPLADVTLSAGGADVKTDKDGKAVIVLPADRQSLSATLTDGGFNKLETKITVSEQSVKENVFTLVPVGKLYFLSRQSGKIDVVKTDLDGSNRQTVVSGTGKEDDRNTVLLASRDWKYLTLLSKRDSGPAKLYLVDTSTDKMSEMDSGDAVFSAIGWNGHDFTYKVQRNNLKYWQANSSALKSFDAEKRQLLTLDQNAADGDQNNGYYQTFGTPYLIGDKLVYSVVWDYIGNNYGARNMTDRNISLRATNIDSVAKKDVRTWPSDKYSSYVRPQLYEPGGLYLAIYSIDAGKDLYFEYEDGAVKDADVNDDDFQKAYPTFLESPDGTKTFWTEQRDGRNAFFIGDAEGTNGKQVTVQDDEFQVYGWYTDNYLLVSKKGSELYIMPATGGDAPFKVADYHKPQVDFRGYGGGYGGL